ncbi:MAG TPA: aldehyde dehydrogenase family protein [Candidatus Limnocylindrales bacterium]|nr:aldehyde dehydrogenase family protein [Candidatus Limnocylindrales bacterium]
MLKKRYPYYLANHPVSAKQELDVLDKYSGKRATRVALADAATVRKAIVAAYKAREAMAAFPPDARRDVLEHCVRRFTERSEELAQALCIEAGKPIKDARGEVTRLIDTFRIAAGEATRSNGELLELQVSPRARGYRGMVKRVPIGACSFITPFNFPLNLVAHKVAPAIAVGAPIVVKPAPATPLTALLLGEILAETELPPGMFSILPLPNDRASALVADPRLPVVSFTGSAPVGAQIRAAVPEKHVTLELGGNAAVLICSDYRNLDWAAQRVALFSNYQGGQSCIAVQRVFVHSSIADAFTEKLVEAVSKLDFDAQVGPLISEQAAQRVQQWVDESGGRVLAGGSRQGTRYEPTVLTDVAGDAKVVTEEVFGPVMVLSTVDSDDAGLDAVNDSKYGLQAGVFTTNVQTAFKAHTTLNVGGVIIGDAPSYRADQMPYGGAKGSGVGREGLRSAMHDYTEARVMVLTNLEL